MKNTNEILSVMEYEFIRFIKLYNTFNLSEDYEVVSELAHLCNRMEIPFSWKWEVSTKNNKDIIREITISGKCIEFRE